MHCDFIYNNTQQSQEQASKLKQLLDQNNGLERQIKERAKQLDAACAQYTSLHKKAEGRRIEFEKLQQSAQSVDATKQKLGDLEAKMEAERSKVLASRV